MFLLLALSLCGCKYNKLLKSPDHQLRYTKGLEYYEKGDYARASQLWEKVILPFNQNTQKDSLQFFSGKSYFLLRSHELAEVEFAQYTRIFPNGIFAEEAYYLRAVNLYMMTSRPSLDQTNTIDALTAFNLFHAKFPYSKYGEGDENYFAELSKRIEEKSYLSAKLYYQIEDYKAAIIALRNSIRDFPESSYNEEQSFLVLKSSYIYAKRSVKKRQVERYISTIDEYYNFVSEYPESKYKKDAETIYKEALTYTNKKNIDIKEELDIKD